MNGIIHCSALDVIKKKYKEKVNSLYNSFNIKG